MKYPWKRHGHCCLATKSFYREHLPSVSLRYFTQALPRYVLYYNFTKYQRGDPLDRKTVFTGEIMRAREKEIYRKKRFGEKGLMCIVV